MTTTSKTGAGPTENPVRHITLDALRGFAVMGILAMNITAFAMPDTAYISPVVYGGSTGADLWSWALGYILFDGKMRGLFSLLFGASMMLIIDRAEAKGESARKVHFSRMGWLAIFGLAHFFFIWFGDILFLYAAIGCLAFRFRKWEPKRLIKWALGIMIAGFLIYSAGMGGMFYGRYMATSPNASPTSVQDYKELQETRDFSPAYVQEMLDLHRGSWAGIVAYKVKEKWYGPLIFVGQSFHETLPMMMLGMALFKNGFLTGGWATARYRRWAIRGIGSGALATALIAWILWRSGFNIVEVLNAFIAWMILPRLVMTLGYAAALVLLVQRLAGSQILDRIAATGRAAFTNYLGTSIVMTTIFYGYGFGLFGHVSRSETWVFVIGAWVVMLIWSKPWLDSFYYGPFEWLWRSLARGKMQAMRR